MTPRRLLFLTNFYPPASRGGYEQWCQEVAEGLRARGHDVIVLTSRHGRGTVTDPTPAWVHRDLHLEMSFASFVNSIRFFTDRTRHEHENCRRLCTLITETRPDAILVWGMWNLHRSLPALAESLLPGRVVYYLGDYWPTLPSQHELYWQTPGRHPAMHILKQILGFVARRQLHAETQPALTLEHGLFPTRFLRDELARHGYKFHHSEIVPGAVDTSLYPYRNGATTHNDILSLLYAGRLTHDKGVHTAIDALDTLVHTHKLTSIRLTIAGSGDSEYEAHLHENVRQKGLTSYVSFIGSQSKEAMPQLYASADALLFPSLWQEPFGRVLIEAMASGVVVIGTATGGAAEILVDNHNALVFDAGDAGALATQIVRLYHSPALRRRLADAGRHTALTTFDINTMTAGIERYLERVLT